MTAVDTIEQLHAQRLDPKCPGTVADGWPFCVEIGSDERIGEGADLKPGGIGVAATPLRP